MAAKPYGRADRERALTKLMRFAHCDEFADAHTAALMMFWGDRLAEDSDERITEVMASEPANIAYNSWFMFDFSVAEGRTMLDLFLQREGKKLPAGERCFLDGLRDSHLRLYEILAVRVDEGFELRDLWDDRRLYVRERAASRELVAWDLIIARVGLSGSGQPVFETLPYAFPASAKEDLLKGLRKAHKFFVTEFPHKSISDFFKKMAPVFHQSWLDYVALRPVPRLMTADGEPLVFAKVLFDLFDRKAVTAALAERNDIIDSGAGTYDWVEPFGGSQRSRGVITVEEKRVLFEAMSKKHAERGRDELAALLGGGVRFRAISYEDVGQALKHAPAAARKQSPEIPPEVQAEVVGKYYAEYYRKWLDEPVPALGNRTPRHAARLKTIRPKLIALLKDFESRAERQRRSGQTAYDFTWMWEELGLTRE